MKKIKNALLVDDNATVNYLNKRLFDRLGAAERLTVARNGKEAIARVVPACTVESEEGNCPDLILLDVKMPVMDGFEFLREYSRLRLHHPSVVYLLTTTTHPLDLGQVAGYPVAGVLEKPLTEETLQQVIERHF